MTLNFAYSLIKNSSNMHNRYRINVNSCHIEFELYCSKCKGIDCYRFVVTYVHTKDTGYSANGFPLITVPQIF